MSITDGLNKEQKEAVLATEGPLLILAGAGSGKTKVLTHRIVHIIHTELARQEEILAVTFTNKAAGEMKERISKLLSEEVNKNIYRNLLIPWCGTFHSVCVKILRREGVNIGIKPGFSIYDSNDSLDTIKEAMSRLMISKKDVNPNAIKSTISSAKNELIGPKEYTTFAETYFQELVAKIYPVYQSILIENNSLDFDDLIMRTTELFDKYPKILEKYTNQFKYIHIDEYQDTNNAQYYLIKQLSGAGKNKMPNICVVGDDDQSIYGFRGANIQNILSFEKDFSNAKVIKLEQNYRSTQRILDASHSIVNKNKKRMDKKLWTENGLGESISLYCAYDENDEADWVSTECEKAILENKIQPRDIAILYRTNAQSRAMEECLIKYDIPYRIVGGVRFYDRKEIRDIIAYLRVISNPDDEISLSRIINTPRRGIGDKTLQEIKDTARSFSKNVPTFLLDEIENIKNNKIKLFAETLKDINSFLNEKSLTEFIKRLIERIGYIEYLDDGTTENQSRIENIKELLTVASKYDKLDVNAALKSFLEDVSLIEDQSGEEDPNSVTLMTVHASKGLEFKYVFIIGMEESLFPHSRSMYNPEEMEEERRLAYVAVTRAKDFIAITHAESRIYFGQIQTNQRSRFLDDIPTELISEIRTSNTFESVNKKFFDNEVEETFELEVEVGDKVKHQIFGNGEIIEINDDTVIINFGDSIGKKELAKEYARLERL